MPPDLFARARQSLTIRSRIGRELLLLGTALLLGLIGVPLATWFVGNRILGPYVHGSNAHAGPMALLGDFFAGLGQGALSFWVVALGPVLIIGFVRLAWALINSRPRNKSNTKADPKLNRRIEPTVSKDRL